LGLNAALKRRSSTVLHASMALLGIVVIIAFRRCCWLWLILGSLE